jgi:predicted RNA-binding protein with TRAM domain
VNVGDVHTVKIESKGKSGDGLARVQGFVVFVPGVNVGDEVKIRIKELRQRFAIAEVVTE